MGRDADARALRRHPRIATSGAALTIGALIVVMLASLGLISALNHQFRLSDLGLVAVYLSFAVVGVIWPGTSRATPSGAGARPRHGVDGGGGHCFATRVSTS
jgi:hypothetical protein